MKGKVVFTCPVKGFLDIIFLIYIFVYTIWSIFIVSLDVGKLYVPFVFAFSAKATFPHSAYGVDMVRYGNRIDKADATSDVIREPLSPWSTENWAAQTVWSKNGNFEGFLLASNFKKLETWAKKFLVPLYVRTFDNWDGEERFFHILSLIDNLEILRHIVELILKVVVEILSGQRTHLSLFIHRITKFNFFYAFNYSFFESVVMFLVNDKSFGSCADLTSIDASPFQSFRDGQLNISIFQNNKGIVAS